METGDGSPGAAQLAVGSPREHDRGAVKALLEPRRYDADHSLMPVGAIYAQRITVPRNHPVESRERLFVHRRLDLTPLAIQPVELRGERCRARFVVGQKAGDADRHIGETPRGVEPRSDDEAKVI